jgi:hypothetical protein
MAGARGGKVRQDAGPTGSFPIDQMNEADGRFVAWMASKHRASGMNGTKLWTSVFSGSLGQIQEHGINRCTPGSGGNAYVWWTDDYSSNLYQQGTPDPAIAYDYLHRSPNADQIRALVNKAIG